MALITPTVETIGDEALTNSLIDRSITELQDSTCVILGTGALEDCAQLERVVFTDVARVESSAFAGCSVLKTVDLHKATYFRHSALSKAYGVTALILRADTVCSLIGKTVHTAFDKSTFYIYVPATLVDAYKANSAWSTYSSKIRAIEDYPEVCDPYSWEAVSYHIENGTYKDAYKIGDTVPVDLGSEGGNNVSGVINMQIAAFDADTLAEGTGTAAISWVAKEVMYGSKYNNATHTSGVLGTGTLGGWEMSSLRAFMKDSVKPFIPVNVESMIVPVTKTQIARDSSGKEFTQTTTDDVWAPSKTEVSSGIYAALFDSNSARIKLRNNSGQAEAWWLRDAASSTLANYVNGKGAVDYKAYNNIYYICLGFCTGRTPT